MVNSTPSEPYVGYPDAVNWSEAPDLKSMDVAPPSAGSAGQPDCVVGSHMAYVCEADGCMNKLEIVAMAANRSGKLIARKSRRSSMSLKFDFQLEGRKYAAMINWK